MLNNQNIQEKSNEFNGYTRVTEVLYPFSGLGKIDPQIVQNAADRGTRVHQICEGIISGIGEWAVDDSVAGYVDSFKSWWAEGHDVISMEERFFDHGLRITGKADVIIRTPKGCTIIDFKTSSKESKTWALQGSAYAKMAIASGYAITDIAFIHLQKDGSLPRIYHYENQWDLFVQCLNVYNYFYAKQPRKTRKAA